MTQKEECHRAKRAARDAQAEVKRLKALLAVQVAPKQNADPEKKSGACANECKDTDKKPSYFRNSNFWIAIFTAVLAGVGVLQVNIISRQLDMSKIDQRAWIGIKSINMTMDIGKPLRTNIEIENTGKTPAQNSWFYITLITGKQEVFYSQALENECAEPPENRRIKMSLFPNESHWCWNVTKKIVLTENDITEIKAGTLHVYLFGNIHYQDVFGENHTTQLFQEYSPTDGAFESKQTHNSAD